MHKTNLFVGLFVALLTALPAASGQDPYQFSEDRPSIPNLYLYFTGDLEQQEKFSERYDVVIWHHHPNLINALKNYRVRNPEVTAFMYKELFCILEKETEANESVGHYDWINEHHPEWFQLDAQGNRVEVPDYPGRWMMDMGNEEFREFWIQQTLADTIAGGWDGVFVDDALTNIAAHDLPPLKDYTTDEAIQEVVYGFLARIKEVFSQYDKMVVANVSNTYDYPGMYDKWIKVLDGMMEEHFASTGWTWGSHVASEQIRYLIKSRQLNKWYFAMTYGPWEDEEELQRSLAAYMIGAGDRIYWAYRPYFEHVHSPKDPEWAWSLGNPVSLPFKRDGLWMREFANGLLVLNTEDESLEFDPDGCGIRLGPHNWMIMREEDACYQPDRPVSGSGSEPPWIEACRELKREWEESQGQ